MGGVEIHVPNQKGLATGRKDLAAMWQESETSMSRASGPPGATKPNQHPVIAQLTLPEGIRHSATGMVGWL